MMMYRNSCAVHSHAESLKRQRRICLVGDGADETQFLRKEFRLLSTFVYDLEDQSIGSILCYGAF